VNDKSNDRRVRKTKKALRDALSTLMSEKDIKDISVRELTELADLNRGTFYLHYTDVYALKQQLENELIGEITLILDEYFPGKSIARPYPLFITLLGHIQENATTYKMLLSNHSGRTFLDKLCRLIEIQCQQNWLKNAQTAAASKELAYFGSFAVAGFIATLSRWLELDMETPVDELALMMERMGMYGIGFLDKPYVAER
jgi:AcrR family transcriptional regulator